MAETVPLRYDFGRKEIVLPVSKDEFNEKILMEYIDDILGVHFKNVDAYERLHGVYTGKRQHIWNKVRLDASENNNILLENHEKAMVDFKQGYMYGEPVKYSLANEADCSEELTKLTAAFRKVHKSRIDNAMAKTVYQVGSAYRMLTVARENRRDEAPFEMFNLDYTGTFVVYSGDYIHEKICAGTISRTSKEKCILTVYTDTEVYYLEAYYGDMNSSLGRITMPRFLYKAPNPVGAIPIVESRLGAERMGVIEIVEPIIDGVNNISSNALDALVDYVNSIFYVKNMKLEKADLDAINENRAIELITTDPSRPAEAGYLINQLQQSDIQDSREKFLNVAYALVGVPQVASNFTSGGDTGEARLLGGGWSRAEVVAKQEEAELRVAEEELLDIALRICKSTPGFEVKDLETDNININYARNLNDNLLVKVQSLQILTNIGMPKETSLNMVGLTANPHEVAKEWQLGIDEDLMNVEPVQEQVIDTVGSNKTEEEIVGFDE